MRDLNFFEPYIEKSEFKFDKKIIIFAVGMFAVCSSTGIRLMIEVRSKLFEDAP